VPRPRITEDNFLAHLFKPSKNPLPTGIRKTVLKGTKGQKKARINAWNKLTGRDQEIIRRAGLQDAYLRGDVNRTEAKQRLRGQAVSKGIVKPVRRRRPTESTRDDIYDTFRHVQRVLSATGRTNPDHLRMNAVLMSQHQRNEVRKIKTFDEYRAEADSGDEKWEYTFNDGVSRSLLWYH
jgi:hypothetical protein